MTPEEWQQIDRIFNQALSLSPNQRPAFLSQACGSNAELRRQIELMIESDEDTGFLNPPAAANADSLIKDDIHQARPGEILSHYKIIEQIGVGGMGEVYLAEDLRLNRKVALKILPAKYTQDQDWLQRFRREAMATAKINHQNIITVFEVAEVNGIHFIATEYIEGITLRELLKRGRLDLNKSLEIALQIARAIEAAHAAGIVHRDIKPENIMVRPDGLVKTLDFGLAKLTENPIATVSAEITQNENQSPNLTQKGALMGTPRYMSPEQVRSQNVDERADIFCLGGVLYEMLAGQPPFVGETTQDLFAAILEREPKPLTALVPKLPAGLERVVMKALAKDSGKRHQNVSALLSDLQNCKLALEKKTTPTLKTLTWGAVAVGCLAVIVFFGKDWFRFRQPWIIKSDPTIERIVDKGISSGAGIERASFSPDGKWIAYSFNSDGGTSIWVREVDGRAEWRLTDGKWRDQVPIWSHDGKKLLFTSDRDGKQGIWFVRFDPQNRISTASAQTELVSAPEFLKELSLVEAILVSSDQDEKTVYYEGRGNLYEFDLQSGKQLQLTDFALEKPYVINIVISPDKSLIAYSRQNSTDHKQHIFVKALKGGGAARQVTYGDGGDRYPAWFPDSKSLAYSSSRSGRYQIYVTTISGSEPSRVTFSESQHDFVAVSPKGDRILYILTKEAGRIVSCETQTGREIGITTDSKLNRWPDSSFNGESVLFGSLDANILSSNDLISIQASGAGKERTKIWETSGFDAKWSPTTGQIAFLRTVPGENRLELRIADPKAGSEQLLMTGVEYGGYTRLPYNRLTVNYNWSPDGRQIAYRSSRSGHSNIFTISTDGTATIGEAVSNNTNANLRATSPFFSPLGNAIAYLLEPRSVPGNSNLWSVYISGNPTPVFTNPGRLRLMGWSDSGKEIYLAAGENQLRPLTVEDVRFFKVAVGSGKQTPIVKFPLVYLHSVKLSRDGKRLAFVSRKDGKDNVYEVTNSGQARQITHNNDSEIYLSGLNWSFDGKHLLFSKQTGRSEIWQIQHFR